MDAEIYVLKPFLPEELQSVEAMINHAADAVELFLEEDLNTVMNRYNRSEKENNLSATLNKETGKETVL